MPDLQKDNKKKAKRSKNKKRKRAGAEQRRLEALV
jgi:hypothetical protein